MSIPFVLTAPFMLVRNDGSVMEFQTLACLSAACRSAGIKVASYHVSSISVTDNEVTRIRHEWIARDSMGLVMLEKDIHGPCKPFFSHRKRLVVEAQNRGLPIPYTGSHRGYHLCFRRPRHMAFTRESAVILDHNDSSERLVTCMQKRLHRPPTSWDDIQRSDCGVRCWKKNRRRHWIDKKH